MPIGNNKKVGRPDANQSRVNGGEERPARRTAGGFRDKLTVVGQDPSKVYRWVKDKNEGGYEIANLLARGYTFVSSDSGVKVGEAEVYTSENVGSIIRRIANQEGEFLYLMCIDRDWYEEDLQLKEDRIQEVETGIVRNTGRTPGSDDLYGSIKIDRE